MVPVTLESFILAALVSSGDCPSLMRCSECPVVGWSGFFPLQRNNLFTDSLLPCILGSFMTSMWLKQNPATHLSPKWSMFNYKSILFWWITYSIFPLSHLIQLQIKPITWWGAAARPFHFYGLICFDEQSSIITWHRDVITEALESWNICNCYTSHDRFCCLCYVMARNDVWISRRKKSQKEETNFKKKV